MTVGASPLGRSPRGGSGAGAGRGRGGGRGRPGAGDLPRERSPPSRYEGLAYGDAAAPIDEGQTISQPYIVALMTELLRVAPGDRILQIGTRPGDQAPAP